MNSEILDIQSAMNYLGVKSTTMYKLAPKLGTKCGGWRFHKQVLDDYIKTGKLARSTVSASNDEVNKCTEYTKEKRSTTITPAAEACSFEKALELP